MQELRSEAQLTIEQVKAIVLQEETIELSKDSLKKVQKSFDFLLQFSKDKIIYGINTGFGPMAQYQVDADRQKELQYNLIRSHAAGAGDKIPDSYVKAVMLTRLNSIAKGNSGIHPSCVALLKEMINKNVYPFIPEHGGVGASGDLVQLSHLALVMIGEGKVTWKGEIYPTEDVFKELNLQPITVELREGLSLINGTSVMTGIGLINVIKAKQLLQWSLAASAMLNEIVESFDDHFSKELNAVKQHCGQAHIAIMISKILKDSKLISRRAEYFYNGSDEKRIFRRKVQEYYSLRCLPQILGAVYDTIENAEKVVVDELNSVSDNPIVDLETENVYHGGNFHGDYVSLEMDKLKLAVTRISMLSERQFAFMCNAKLNEKLPPFINLGKLGLNLGMQGVQFTATSTVAENQTLSNSMYVHSITTNNDNQDIVSMGTNSALLTKQVISNAYTVLAIQFIGLLQAVDYLDASTKLAGYTANIYQQMRDLVPKFVEDTPKYEEIEKITQYLFSTEPGNPLKK